MTLGERLKQAREQAGFQFAKEAARAFGWNENTYSSHENGHRGFPAKAGQKYATRFKVDFDWLMTGRGKPEDSKIITKDINRNETTLHHHARGDKIAVNAIKQHEPNAIIREKVAEKGYSIPVYGQAVGGIDGEFIMNGNVLYKVMAPPNISPNSGAYAVCVAGDSMSPRYEDGEIAYVDPRRRVRRGDYVVAQILSKEGGPPYAYIKRFISHNSKELVLEQLNPAKEMRFLSDRVESIHYISMSGPMA